LATDRFGCTDKAYTFDGINDFIEVPHSASLEMSDVNKVTVAAWVKKDSAQSGNIAIVQKSDKSYILRFKEGNKPTFIIDQEPGVKKEAKFDTPVSDNIWYHLVGTYDGTDVKIYVDGDEKVSSAIDAGSVMEDGSHRDLGIGENLENTGRYLHGQIDDISIWDRALTADQVSDYYNQTSHK